MTERTNDSVSASLLQAAFSGQTHVVRELLADRAAVNAQDDFENTALLLAALNGHVDIVQDLLDHGAALTTALTWAVSQRRHAVTKVLLDHGAVVSKTDRAMIDDWLLWLEAHAEEAYDKMYDARNSTDAAGSYSNAKGYLDDALALAGRLELPEMVARLEARLAHIKAVFRSQFSS